ncbi:Glycoside hydrolase, family 76 [Metarhizium album ARSEF 1941]|uniref:Glycoside hydrolase, family 76 n=1 Tax=Metarhizium album (strain ARSEF 1941) TaxID=1081103 RepID=A0A0B2WDN2_METAS|nr:Glycoside hydrolase, family 76 [Metarhizium album ARSEF 1941]KHN93981.1 Glycoside hydrolase, family 76 [Metarhizium album ARSEF 1941]
MTRLLSIASLGAAVISTFTAASSLVKRDVDYCSVYNRASSPGCQPVPGNFLDSRDDAPPTPDTDSGVLEDAFSALSVLQNVYFEPVNGTWPTSIDWTGAVVETVIAGMLTTLSKSLDSTEKGHSWKEKENLISSIFAQVTHSFFGQNAVGILGQAYDDVLWVVLGWLEAIKFVRLHSTLHYPGTEQKCLNVPGGLSDALGTISYHGYNWYCTFAERARAFWDFATRGWDTRLCHGGMIWNPRLLPYKNAITNELWIAASISMYEYFPDDKFDESWTASQGFPINDPVYLAAAIVGYKWLKDVNMTNTQGLYVDGYHVDMSKPNNVECDQRDEMVYTYNQGVILTGQRGLYTVTGSPSYLEDGHALVRNVIKATGWSLGKNAPIDNMERRPRGKLPRWRGIGRGGILEEQCDVNGTCSQDSQTFKGIFFHHLTAFCAPISPVRIPDAATVNKTELGKAQCSHDKTCRRYLPWIKYNMDAALATRDKAGRFGMWWGASVFDGFDASGQTDGMNLTSPNTTDYRNKGTPIDVTWGLNMTWRPGSKTVTGPYQGLLPRPDPKLRTGVSPDLGVDSQILLGRQVKPGDANDRGRGRTVETQVGGLALIRAFWELSQPSSAECELYN